MNAGRQKGIGQLHLSRRRGGRGKPGGSDPENKIVEISKVVIESARKLSHDRYAGTASASSAAIFRCFDGLASPCRQAWLTDFQACFSPAFVALRAWTRLIHGCPGDVLITEPMAKSQEG